jgi:hypothetical protein
MESIETSITAPVSPQVRKPSVLDRLLFSAWYLEARTVLDQFVAYRSDILRKLNRFVGGVQ